MVPGFENPKFFTLFCSWFSLTASKNEHLFSYLGNFTEAMVCVAQHISVTSSNVFSGLQIWKSHCLFHIVFQYFQRLFQLSTFNSVMPRIRQNSQISILIIIIIIFLSTHGWKFREKKWFAACVRRGCRRQMSAQWFKALAQSRADLGSKSLSSHEILGKCLIFLKYQFSQWENGVGEGKHNIFLPGRL